MKTKLQIFLLLLIFPMLCFSQEVNRTRQEVIDSMEEYIWFINWDFDESHTNKWQNNYYDTDGAYNHSTFLGYEGSQYGAPYGYGVKDDLTMLDNKITGEGVQYDLSLTEEQYISLYPGIAWSDSADQIIITSTRYLENDWLTIAVDVDDEYSDWQLKLYQKGFGYDSNQGMVYEVRNEIWQSGWLTGDQTLNTSPIEYTGKYCLIMETGAFSLTAQITLTKPLTVPDENNYACGSHSHHYHVCSQLGMPLPSQWAFGIDCSGFVSWGYGLPIASYGTIWYANNFYSVDYAEAQMADYLVKSGGHMVMIKNKSGDNIDIYHSAGTLEWSFKPDGTEIEYNKHIYRDYISKGYDSRTPWNPTGIEDYIAITDGPTLLNQEETQMYYARFFDEYPYGDKIMGNWHWKLVACYEGGEIIIDTCDGPGEYSSTGFLTVPDLDTMDYNWIRNEQNSIVGKVRLSASDNSGKTHGTVLDIEIIEDIETPVISKCYGGNQNVTLSFTAFGATTCNIYYDVDSGHPYNGNDADQGSSPILFQGDSGKITLTGLTNCTTYYFAIEASNYYEQTEYSQERYATPITTSGRLAQNETWPGIGNPDTIVVLGNVTVPSGITLTIESNSAVDVNEYTMNSTGGTINRQDSIIFIPDVRLFNVSYEEITGQYSDLQEALNDASSSEEVHVYSDVSINDNISIPSNRTLKIMPGSSLKFACGKALNVYGEIYAYGQWNNRVVFTSIEPYTQWEGIKFYSNSYQYSYIYHCEISNANYGIYLDHHEPMNSYRYNYIHHCNYGIFSRYSAPEIKDSYIQDNYLFGVYVMYGNPAFPSWHIRIAENDIRTTDEYDGIFLWESDATIWADNDIFDNHRYGVNAYTYSDVILVSAESGLNSVHYNHEGQLHFYDHCDGHVGHSGYYNTYGATNRILGNSYRVVAEASSDVYARRVWWGVHWWGWNPPEGLFYSSAGSTIDSNFPLEYDPQPSMLASTTPPKNITTKLVHSSSTASTSADIPRPIHRAIRYVFEAKYDSATALCDSVIRVDPGHQDAIHAQSLLWRISRRTKGSDFFTTLSTNEQKYNDLEIGAAAQRIKGLLLAGGKDYQSAATQLERVLAEAKYNGTSTHKHVLFDLIDLYHFDLKQDDVAKKYLEELTLLFPKDESVKLANLMMDVKTQESPNPGLNKPNQEVIEPEIPQEYFLHQCYPNPFNSSTTIRFQLPESNLVTLEIYNMMGQKIKTLINGEYKTGGFHQSHWDGRDEVGNYVSSGIYVYYFRAGKFFDSKKLILMK
ncbi:MAG: T9SS type A sorting domain-containing protein [Candidatus Zhuqueibacterota bacterium]